jgi:hypothetical protein
MKALDDLDGTGAGGEASTATTRLLLQVVADQLGPAGVERVLQRAGMRPQKTKLRGRSTLPRLKLPIRALGCFWGLLR